MPIRLAYLTNQYPAVSHTFIRHEIAGLERLGVEVRRFSLRASTAPRVDAADRAEALRTEIFEDSPARLVRSLAALARKRPRALARAIVHGARLGLRSRRGLLRHAGYLVAAAHLTERCEALGVDHVHAHFGTNPAAIAMLAQALGGPAYSFTVHGPEEFDDVWALSLPEKVAGARFVIAVSDFGKSQIYRHVPRVHWSRVEVVRCSVGERFIRRRVTPPPHAPRLVTVGRLSAQKGHSLLVEAAAQLVREGVPLELILVGDGELRHELERAIASHGLERSVRITGWASNAEVHAWLEGARALILPSFGEGLPVVLMEALVAGRPVVTTSIAGIPELVETGKNGIVVPAGSVDALRDGIRAILEATPETLAAMGAEGRRRVLALHHPDRNAEALLAVFQRYTGLRLSSETRREPARLPADASIA
jgi:colanic acid/amylovoran biosynthesis glycosyltransferase